MPCGEKSVKVAAWVTPDRSQEITHDFDRHIAIEEVRRVLGGTCSGRAGSVRAGPAGSEVRPPSETL
jgi:hypothetical protein